MGDGHLLQDAAKFAVTGQQVLPQILLQAQRTISLDRQGHTLGERGRREEGEGEGGREGGREREGGGMGGGRERRTAGRDEGGREGQQGEIRERRRMRTIN